LRSLSFDSYSSLKQKQGSPFWLVCATKTFIIIDIDLSESIAMVLHFNVDFPFADFQNVNYHYAGTSKCLPSKCQNIKMPTFKMPKRQNVYLQMPKRQNVNVQNTATSKCRPSKCRNC
jgi:hypothetical protein